MAADEGVRKYAPGSVQWIAALRADDEDALRLDRLDVSVMDADAAARLWAKVAAWVESDQVAYYIDDSPVSSDAAYDARMRCLQRLEAAFPSLDSPQSPTHRVGGAFSNDFVSVRHPSRMMSLDDVFSIEELHDWYNGVREDLEWPEDKPLLYRICAADFGANGVTQEESDTLARELARRGVDLIDVQTGNILPGYEGKVYPGYQVPYAERIRAVSGLPTAATGSIASIDLAEDIIGNGRSDLIFMGRTLLRDPFWPIRAAREAGVEVDLPIPTYARATGPFERGF